jgi:DNA processing protein
MPSPTPHTLALLRLTLTPGLGPVLITRALETFGSPDAVLAASESALRRIKGVGDDRARTIAKGLADSAARADDELSLADSLNVSILAKGDPAYPPLLAQIPDAPPILYIRGALDPAALDRFPVAIVGSRACTHYGTEQTERFSAHMAAAGLTIVSGGARGIDTAAHRAALRVKGRTVAVLGCGLAECYPPDNRALFDQIAAGEGASGAVVSELPLRTPPNAENFPARNRIISGLSLGVLVVEAARRSGALITARLAAEEHGREVFALPSRVDSSAAEGSLDLLKSGGAALVTHPEDIIQALEAPARHVHHGTHAARYAAQSALDDSPVSPGQVTQSQVAQASRLCEPSPTPTIFDTPPAPPAPPASSLTPAHQSILAALDKPQTLDQLAATLALDPAALRAQITMLEIRRRVTRRGSLIERVSTEPRL